MAYAVAWVLTVVVGGSVVGVAVVGVAVVTLASAALVILHGYRAITYLIGRIHARHMVLASQPNLTT